MHQTKRATHVLLASVLAVASLSACARQAKQSETAQRAAGTSGELSSNESLRTSVESIDQSGRSVTLRDADGRPFTIVTADPAALASLQPKDAVRLVYQEAIAFQLQELGAGDAPAQPVTVQHFETHPSPKGEGIEFRRHVDTVVQILAVAPEGRAATFRIPEGTVRAVEIDDVKNREKVKRLKPGDAVAVAYTEKLRLERDR